MGSYEIRVTWGKKNICSKGILCTVVCELDFTSVSGNVTVVLPAGQGILWFARQPRIKPEGQAM